MDPIKGTGIVGARRRLDSVLEGLVDRSQESLSGLPDDNSEIVRETAMGLLQLPNRTPEAAHALSQSKRGGSKSPRKRRRRDNTIGGNVVVESHVMKLFDRSVDLARFSEETPVYVICRDWMRNLHPPARISKVSFGDSDSMMGLDLLSSASMLDGNVGDPVWSLPAAQPISEAARRAVELPTPLPLEVTKASVDKALNVAVNGASGTQVPAHRLLQENLKRWRRQRQLKRRLVQVENERYRESWLTLQSLRLHICSNTLTSRGLCALAKCLHHNSMLTHVYVWGNNFDHDACKAFAALLGDSPRIQPENIDVRPYIVDGVTYLAHVY